MTAQITREAALRLGLAAAELGGISVAAFAQAVGERLGLICARFSQAIMRRRIARSVSIRTR